MNIHSSPLEGVQSVLLGWESADIIRAYASTSLVTSGAKTHLEYGGGGGGGRRRAFLIRWALSHFSSNASLWMWWGVVFVFVGFCN